MKDIIKIIKMAVVLLTIAIIIYPFTHELGHTLACIMLGAEVLEFRILPIPYVLCNITFMNKIDNIIIGNAGNIFPAIIVYITYLFKLKNFNIRLARFYFNFCCILSYIIAIISIIITKLGKFNLVYQDDTAQLVNMYNNIWLEYIIIYTTLTIISLTIIIINKPIKAILEYFDLKEEQ